MKVSHTVLQSRIKELLIAVGENTENAETASYYMMLCDARGVTTHGSHMMNPICDRRAVGQLNFPTRLETLVDEDALTLIDGNDGLGQVAANYACELVARKARKSGIATVMLRNTNNVGALGPYVEKLARQGLVAFMCCNASPAMAPWGGMEQFMGTQPFAVGIYTGNDTVFSADMATANVARGKIRKALREGQSIPDTWALDKDGKATTDPKAAIEGIVLPMGGPKGSAIALTIDIIAGMLSGSNYAPNVKAIHYPEGKAGIGVSIIAVDIAHFMPLVEFEEKIQAYMESIRTMKKADGVDRIFIPGEIEQTRIKNSIAEGIELTDTAINAFNERLKAYSLAPLTAL